ncbi:hypothetical protein CNMCM5793_008400 [Aspergillus hiratsukae]|uniref:Uncharacterized protein n=1 Tax=Aspergillus hiratsukae TaxID=1194566 RepID=A0A8H6UNC4_9EURO|nr:hypothetical protein CNMCM5793_008400 [Aspergillus hiratsukae]KAF7158204.1 hypothetical protein CNMCM6106_004570 [Aspergillus hiratsukae]
MQLLFISILTALILSAESVCAATIMSIDPEQSQVWSAVSPDQDTVVPDCFYQTVLVGNGNPHINYFDKQMTQTVTNCDQPNVVCSTGATQGTTFSWSVSGTLNPINWISGGFDVGVSYSSSVNEGCSAGAPNQDVCLWYQQAYVAYTVQNVWSSPLCGTDSSSYILWSPTNGNACGRGYYCVVNTCRSIGQGYWTLSGPAGWC